MQRQIVLALLIAAFSVISHAQSHPENPQTDPSLRLSEEDFQFRTPPYPFEDELNACIRKDIGARGFGEPCTSILFKYCPEPAMSEELNAGLRCAGFGIAYWRDRLGVAAAALIPLFEDQDRDAREEDQRAPKFRDLQQKWAAWRAAKCDFEYFKVPGRSPWVRLDAADCQYQLTANRALEVELLLRIAKY